MKLYKKLGCLVPLATPFLVLASVSCATQTNKDKTNNGQANNNDKTTTTTTTNTDANANANVSVNTNQTNTGNETTDATNTTPSTQTHSSQLSTEQLNDFIALIDKYASRGIYNPVYMRFFMQSNPLSYNLFFKSYGDVYLGDKIANNGDYTDYEYRKPDIYDIDSEEDKFDTKYLNKYPNYNYLELFKDYYKDAVYDWEQNNLMNVKLALAQRYETATHNYAHAAKNELFELLKKYLALTTQNVKNYHNFDMVADLATAQKLDASLSKETLAEAFKRNGGVLRFIGSKLETLPNSFQIKHPEKLYLQVAPYSYQDYQSLMNETNSNTNAWVASWIGKAVATGYAEPQLNFGNYGGLRSNVVAVLAPQTNALIKNENDTYNNTFMTPITEMIELENHQHSDGTFNVHQILKNEAKLIFAFIDFANQKIDVSKASHLRKYFEGTDLFALVQSLELHESDPQDIGFKPTNPNIKWD